AHHRHYLHAAMSTRLRVGTVTAMAAAGKLPAPWAAEEFGDALRDLATSRSGQCGGPLLAGEVGGEGVQEAALGGPDPPREVRVAAEEPPRFLVHLRRVGAGAGQRCAGDDVRQRAAAVEH